MALSPAATRAEGPDAFEVQVLDGFDALRRHEAALRRGERDADFYATWPWFELLSRDGIDSAPPRLLVLVQHRGSGATLCLPLLRRADSAAAVFGGAVTGLSNYYSSLYGPIGDSAALTVPALRAALQGLARHSGQPAVIDLQPLDVQGEFLRCMREALRAEGYASDGYFCFGNWHLPVAGRSFAAYEPGLPSRLRNTIKRGRKKLDAAGAWTLQVHREPGVALEAGIADFEAIYARSWKVPEPFPAFVPGLCRSAAAQGWLRLGVIRFEDKAIAAQLWIVKDGKAMIYKLAYDEAYKRFSAGSVLSQELMRRAFDEDRVDDVDYLTGDDGYKVDWMSHRRERVGLVAFRPWTPAGGASLLRHRLGQWWRKRRAAARPAATMPAAPATTDDA